MKAASIPPDDVNQRQGERQGQQKGQQTSQIVCYLGLGANLGPREAALQAALAALRERVPLSEVHRSPIYETDAVADHPQPPYLNAVIRARTSVTALQLLADCLAVEAQLGRTRPPGLRRAARVIDIDILLFGAEIIDTPTLRVPHPELAARPFVRIPLADVAAPGLVHPVTGERLDTAPPAPTSVRPWLGQNPGQ